MAAAMYRSIRCGFRPGSTRDMTISSWSTLATRTCSRRRDARVSTPCRGSTRSITPVGRVLGPSSLVVRADSSAVGHWGVIVRCGRRPIGKGRRTNPDSIPRGHDTATVGGQRLEQPADGALEDAAVLSLDVAVQPVHAEHPAGQAGVGVDGPAGPPCSLALADGHGPVAGQVALGPDPFAGLGVVARLLGVGRELAGDVVPPGRLGPVPAELDPDFLLLGHW